MGGKQKIAYCVIPEPGGLFSFYLNLRKALAPHGREVVAACSGAFAKKRWNSAFADDSCHLIAPDEKDPCRLSEAFSRWVDEQGVDIVMPMDDSVAASALPHLRRDVRLVTRCSTVSDFGFRICLLCPERLNRIVVMTPAQERRMLRYAGAEGRVELIPHGVDINSIQDASHRGTENTEDGLRLLYIGRLEDRSKGVMYLPQIAERLMKAGVEFEMDIIGDGPDRRWMELDFREAGLGGRVRFTGALTKSGLVERLNTVRYDVLVLPSRYEGFPNAVLEAMAAGIVPVVSRIDGVSDFVIEDGVSGLVCGIGKANEFASAIASLAGDRQRLRSMSSKTRETVCERFSLERMGRDYDRLFKEVLAAPVAFEPLSWGRFEVDRNYRPSWRKYLPQWLKNLVRRFVRV